MDRFLVPRMGLAAVAALAIVLIGVLLRNPDAHSNLWNRVRTGYFRTPVGVLAPGGNTAQLEVATGSTNVALYLEAPVWQTTLHPEAAGITDAGQRLYIAAGCAKCHGVDGEGGVVGPPLAGKPPVLTSAFARLGPKGMPSFPPDILSDDELAQIAEYLASLEPVNSR